MFESPGAFGHTRAHTLRDKRALIRTYEGTQLFLPDDPPDVNVLPHNRTHLGTVQELHGLGSDGRPQVPQAAKFHRRRQRAKFEWQQGMNIAEKARARRFDMQRLKRILLEHTAARRRVERKVRVRRTAAAVKAAAPNATVKMGTLDQAVERELRALRAQGDCSASKAGAIDRALTLRDAQLHLDETKSEQVERLAKPRYVKKMPWNEGYRGSPDEQYDALAWAYNLRAFDWDRELAARKDAFALKQEARHEDAKADASQRDAASKPPTHHHHHELKATAQSPPVPFRPPDAAPPSNPPRRRPHQRPASARPAPRHPVTREERKVAEWVSATGNNLPFTFDADAPKPRPPVKQRPASAGASRRPAAEPQAPTTPPLPARTAPRPASAAAGSAVQSHTPALPQPPSAAAERSRPRARPRTAGPTRELRKMIVSVANRCLETDALRDS